MNTLDIILKSKIIAIARGIYGKELIDAAKALYEGGIRAFEVTFEQNGSNKNTADAIFMLKRELPDECTIGAGTVLNEEQLEQAKSAGAEYIVSPNVNIKVITKTKQLGLISIPGAMTPSEVVAAHEAGADIVKLFPAGELGIAYFKAVRAPLSHIRLAAVAGINHGNIAEFKKAGASAFGISSGLFIKAEIKNGNYNALTRNAAKFIDEIN